MDDAHGLSGKDILLDVESLQRNVGRLMQEMREVKTALFKLRSSAVELAGDEEVGKPPWVTNEYESSHTPDVTVDVEELGTAVVQADVSSDVNLGKNPRNCFAREMNPQ